MIIMTRKQDELQPRSYDNLLYAVENMHPGADEALGQLQKIRDAGGTPEILHSAHHGWVVGDSSK